MKGTLVNEMSFSECPQRSWLFYWMIWILVNEMSFSEWNERNEFSIYFNHFQWMKWMNGWMNGLSEWNEWMNEWNDWMEWINEWMSEWMKWNLVNEMKFGEWNEF